MVQICNVLVFRLAGPADWWGQEEEKTTAKGVKMAKSGSDPEKWRVFSHTKKKKEVCFRLKGEIPPKHPHFKLSRMCSFQALQVHLQSQSFSSFSSWLHFSQQLWVYWLLGFGMLLPIPRKLAEMKASDLIQRKVPGYLVPLCPP